MMFIRYKLSLCFTAVAETWQEVDIPVMERGDTLVETEEDRDTFEEKTTEGRSATRASNDVTTKLPDVSMFTTLSCCVDNVHVYIHLLLHTLFCKTKRQYQITSKMQYLRTSKVSRYCVLSL